MGVRVSKSLSSLGLLAIGLLTPGCTPRHLGPWSPVLRAPPPAFEWAEAERSDLVRSLYYTGEPYQGHPTRVFAWYAPPAPDAGQAGSPGTGHPNHESGVGRPNHESGVGRPDQESGVGRPARLKAPAMVLVHGGGGKAFREWAELWANRGYAAIAMDLAGRGPDGKRLPDGGPDQGYPDKFDAIAGGVKNAWPYHAVANVIRAHSLLRSFPDVDVNRTGITGISWGGYLTCIAAGLDGRFKVAVPVYGCGFLQEDSVWLPDFAKLSPADRQLWHDTFDPSMYLPGCRIPILFMNGTNDFAYPLDSYQKSYRLVRGPRTLCVTVKMPHSHPDGWAPKEIGIFVDSVLKGGKPLAHVEGMTRRGRDVVVRFRSVVPIKEAALHYTTDSGPWQKREWTTQPATIVGTQAKAVLPTDKGIVYFITLKDERDAVVSTDHEEAPGNSPPS